MKRSIFAVITYVVLAPAAYAACTGPAGIEGEIIYNSQWKVMQFCDNEHWIAMGSNGGDSTTTLTGDVTGTGEGSVVTTIANGAVTYAKLQNITGSRLLGRAAGTTGSAQEITLGSSLAFAGTALKVEAAGAQGQVQFRDASANLAGDAGLFWDNAGKRLGVGTSAPAAQLHVSGSAVLQDHSALAANNAVYNIISFRDSAGSEYGWLGDGSLATNRMSIAGSATHPVSLVTGGQSRLLVNAAGNVGIGTDSPASRLHVSGDALVEGNLHINIGGLSISGASPEIWTAVGWRKALKMTQGHILLWERGGSGYARGIGGTSAGAFYIARSAANDSSASPIYDFIVDTDGNIAIGGGAPSASYKLDVAGNVRVGTLSGGGGSNFHIDANLPAQGVYLNYYSTGNVYARTTLLASSDARLKKNVATLPDALERLSRIRGVSFDWTDEARKGRQIGVIAQDVEAVYPELVAEDEQGFKTVSYANMVAPLIEAVKTLKAENEALRQRVDALEAER